MFHSHFYHATIRKVIAAFGTVFNNISVVRKDQTGKVVNIQRVPLAYGPKQKFLTRIDEQPDLRGNKIAIKLPRMSFEMVTLVYDASTKINRNNVVSVLNPNDPLSKTTVRQFAPYRMGIQLSIMAKAQDDALQILEQILPFFQPEYTISIKDVEGMDIVNDVPIVLTNIQATEDYEGDFMTRRAIIYTLDFELRVRFYGPTSERGITKTVIANFIDMDTNFKQIGIDVSVNPKDALPTDNYTVDVNISEFTMTTDRYQLDVIPESGGAPTFALGETITDSTTGTTARVVSYNGGVLTVDRADGIFRNGDLISGGTSGAVATIQTTVAIHP